MSLGELPWQVLSNVSQLLRSSPSSNHCRLLRAAAEAGNAAEVDRLLRTLDVERYGNVNAVSTRVSAVDEPELCNAQLRQAAAEGDAQTVDKLLHRGVLVDATDADGTTALHLAAEFHRATVVNALLRAGANVDATDDSGATPLMAAVSSGRGCDDAVAGQTILLLVSAGADINIADDEGLSPLAVAQAEGIRTHAILSSSELLRTEFKPEQEIQEHGSVAVVHGSVEQAACGLSSTIIQRGDSCCSELETRVDTGTRPHNNCSTAGESERIGCMVAESSHKWWGWETLEQTARSWTAYRRISWW